MMLRRAGWGPAARQTFLDYTRLVCAHHTLLYRFLKLPSIHRLVQPGFSNAGNLPERFIPQVVEPLQMVRTTTVDGCGTAVLSFG
jgi:hypothetical protein